MQHIEDVSAAILKVPDTTPGAHWAKPSGGPAVIRYTFVTDKLPSWIQTQINQFKATMGSSPDNTFQKLLNLGRDFTWFHFEPKPHPLPDDLQPYLMRSIQHFEAVADVTFIRDDKNPKLFLHFSNERPFINQFLGSGVTALDVHDGIIQHAAISMPLGLLQRNLDSNYPTNLQHLFSHKLGHILGLDHANITKPPFALSQYTVMEPTEKLDHVVFRPTAADRQALATLYGTKPLNTEDNIFVINATTFEPSETRWIHDDGGNDTLITDCNGKYDLRDGVMEGCGHIFYTTPGAIENIKLVGKNNLVRLNSHSNHVDIRNANVTQIFTDAAENQGRPDFIDGFECGDTVVVTHEGIDALNITHQPNRMDISAGNYTVTVTGNFNSTYTQTYTQGNITAVTNTEPNCIYIEGRSLPSTFAVAFLKSSLIQSIRGSLNSFGCSEIQVDVFDRVLMASATYYETRNLYAASLLTIIGPALRAAGLSKKQAGIIETVLCVSAALYYDPVKAVTSVAGALGAFGMFRAIGFVRDTVFGTAPAPKLKLT